MNLYFTFKFRIVEICSLRLSVSKLAQFEINLRKISRRRSSSPKYAELGQFMSLFCEEWQRLERTCISIVLLVILSLVSTSDAASTSARTNAGNMDGVSENEIQRKRKQK